MQTYIVRVLLFIALLASPLWVGGASAQYPGFDAPSSKGSGGGGGGSGFAPVSPVIDGGGIPMGATSQIMVKFRNDAGQPVETGQINLYPSSTVSAVVTQNHCSKEPLASGAECAIAVSVTGLQAGAWRVEMLMLHSGRSRLVTVTMSGSVEQSADASKTLMSEIETVPDKLDFGALGTSQTLVEPVILRNVTSGPIDISKVSINAAERSGYKVQSDCKTLQAGQACIAVVTWAPTQKGPATGALVIAHSGKTALSSVSLSGDYTPDSVSGADVFPNAVPGKGLLVSSQESVAFGTAVSSASTITVSLVNVGDAPLKIKDIRLAGSDNGLSLGRSGCSKDMTLEPVEACPLTLTWAPTRVGALLDDVQILHDGARGVLVLPVRGTSDSVVSQDQKAIVLSEAAPPTKIISSDVSEPEVKKSKEDDDEEDAKPVAKSKGRTSNVNAASALDGLKITSFSGTRAIVNGPGGSRLIYDDEQIMLGGVVWDVNIQKNGIEFSAGDDKVLLLFDRSLSAVNRTYGRSKNKSSAGGANKTAASMVEPISAASETQADEPAQETPEPPPEPET